jgi:hypothetical protein
MTHSALQRAAPRTAPILVFLTRLGFATKGIVTLLVGVLALRYALQRGGEITGQKGAVETVLAEPLGQEMLAVLGAGLAGYAIWMFVVAFMDPERKGRSAVAVAERLGSFATGIGYIALAFAAFGLVVGRNGGGPDVERMVATILTPHVGRVIIGLAGLIVMTAGVFQLRLAITRRFRQSLESGMSRLARVATIVTGTVGYVTLGLLSLITGWSLLQVAVTYDPSRAKEWEDALWLLAGVGRGRWLLGVAALGLMLYGLYFVLQVRYRRL